MEMPPAHNTTAYIDIRHSYLIYNSVYGVHDKNKISENKYRHTDTGAQIDKQRDSIYIQWWE